MKNFFKFSLLSFAGCLLFAACSKDNDGAGTTPEPLADYTIMMYGCGGGNLDDCMLYNLEQVKGYGYSSKVQFAAKLKFSISYQKQSPETYGGTRLYTLTPDGFDDEVVGGQGYRLDDPQNLADFITDTQERLPAKHYILILWNHGSEFSIRDQLVASSYPEAVVAETRGLVFDDNTDESISIFEQEEALKRANVKLDMIYWDVCLMNSMENIYQIKDYTRYVLGSAHLTPGLGGNYVTLMSELEENSDLLTAMKGYIPASMNHWVNILGTDDACDLTLTDMNYVEAVAKNIKNSTSALISYRDEMAPGSQDELAFQYMNGTAQKDGDEKYSYYSKGGKLYYFFDGYNTVDLSSAFVRIGNEFLNGQLSAQMTKLKMSIDKMILVSACAGTPDYLPRVSLGINWLDKAEFDSSYSQFPIPTMAELYPHLRFDQVAEWSRFLKTNIRKKVGTRVIKDAITGKESIEYYEITNEDPAVK